MAVLLAAGAPPAAAASVHQEKTPASLTPQLQALRAGLPQDVPQGVPVTLPDHLPLLLVDFADRPHSSLVTPDTLQSRFFGSGASVASFLLRSSYGQFQLQGETTPWLRLPQTLDYYANGRGGVGVTYPRNAQRMVEDAVRAADPHIDFSRYDNDGPDGIPSSGDDDGFVDGVMVVHAGPGAELGDPDNILSHSLYTSAAVPTDDGPAVWLYATVSETSRLGVNAHEFGHILGLPDLYQFGGRRSTSGGIGEWSLMAGGAWSGDGFTPTDIDAPSKIELGWINPIVPTRNRFDLRLRVAQAGQPPDVYKVWSRGRPDNEYFVVVNRRRGGDLDSALPAGGGMLVYHVDLHQPDNSDRDAMRVQLLQADGDRDIELFVNNGDEGDPFPGSTANIVLAADTNPSTRSRAGDDTGVLIRLDSAPSAEMRIRILVGSQPHLEVLTTRFMEIDGDADGVVEPGEVGAAEIWLTNIGETAASGMFFEARLDSSQGSVLTPGYNVPIVHAGDSLQVRFDVRAATTLANPSALELQLRSSDFGGTNQNFPLHLPIGNVLGFQACLEPVASSLTQDCSDPAAAWESSALTGPATWTTEMRPGEMGLVYRSAASATYPNNADMVLVSPPFNLQAQSTLQLLHDFDTEDLGGGYCMDGGLVEISVGGGPWEQLEPDAAAPRRMFAYSVGYLAEAAVFGGRAERRWDDFFLGNRQGSARLRFRFVSGDSIRAAGWSIYRVEVAASPVQVTPGMRVAIEPNPVRFPSQVRFRIDADRSVAARSTQLRIYDVRGRLVRHLEHAAVPAQTARFLWDGTDRAGVPVASGIYWAQVEWGSQRATSKLTVLR